MARPGWLRIATWACACWMVAACGGDDAAKDPSPIPEDQFLLRLAEAVCDNIGSCCKTAGFSYDGEQCKVLAAMDFSQQFAMSDAKMKYDAAAGAKCVQAAGAASASCGAFAFDAAPSCSKVLTGTVAEGEPCDGSSQCIAPAGGYALCFNGACSGQTFVQQGGSCGPSAACAKELYCASGTCEPTRADGETCAGPSECASKSCEAGTCVKRTLVSQNRCTGI